MTLTRKYTTKILEAVEEGILDRDTVIMACLKYMSEDDVKDMAVCNEFFPDDDDDDDDEEGGSEDYDPAERCVDNLINGNLTDARDMAKVCSDAELRKELFYHFEDEKTELALTYLRTGEGWQAYCDAE